MVAGLWDGDYPGPLEDAATTAKELLEHLDEVEKLLKEIEHMDRSDIMLR